MRVIIPALVASLALAGCQTTIDSADEAIQKNLPIACQGVSVAHASFLALEGLHPLKASIVAAERIAYSDAAAYCAHPETATTVSALATVVRSTVAIVAALREAEKIENAAGP